MAPAHRSQPHGEHSRWPKAIICIHQVNYALYLTRPCMWHRPLESRPTPRLQTSAWWQAGCRHWQVWRFSDQHAIRQQRTIVLLFKDEWVERCRDWLAKIQITSIFSLWHIHLIYLISESTKIPFLKFSRGRTTPLHILHICVYIL